MLIPGGVPLWDALCEFIRGCSKFVIFAPYIRSDVLAALLDQAESARCTTVVTTWRPEDVAFGASDLGVYSECKSRGVALLLNPRLHMKLYVEHDLSRGILATANLSRRALGLATPWNHEAGVLVDPIGVDGTAYLDSVLAGAFAVTDEMFEFVRDKAASLPAKPSYEDDFEIPETMKRVRFVLTALPMSSDVSVLGVVLQDPSRAAAVERRAAFHDANLYGLAMNEGQLDRERLRAAFFGSPIIAALLTFNQDGRRFGELTAWLHEHVADVPAPHRYDVKAALQRVLAFVVELAPERYRLERVGRHTLTLRRISG